MYMRDAPHHHLLIDIIGGADPDTFVQGREVTRPNTEAERAQAANAAERRHAQECNRTRMAEVALEFARRLKGGPVADDLDPEELRQLLEELLVQLGIAGGLPTKDAAARPGLSVTASLAKIRQDAARGEAYAQRLKERSRVVHDGAPDPIVAAKPNPRDPVAFAAWAKARREAKARG